MNDDTHKLINTLIESCAMSRARAQTFVEALPAHKREKLIQMEWEKEEITNKQKSLVNDGDEHTDDIELTDE